MVLWVDDLVANDTIIFFMAGHSLIILSLLALWVGFIT
jgi:hypothetical protein